MGQHILSGNPPIELTLRRSARARRISLRVSELDGRVTLTMPRGLSEKAALEFAHEKRDWLARQLGAHPGESPVLQGAELPVEGEVLRIAQGQGRRVLREGDVLFVPGPAEATGARTRAWLKTLARERLAEASDRHAARLGRPYARISLRDTRSRWGSCSSQGTLMYSWRLIMAPPGVLDYVAAHEVAHLAEMNHSQAFWDEVARLLPGYDAPRRWLRANGAGLHRYRFDS